MAKSKKDPRAFLFLFKVEEEEWVTREFERHARSGDRDASRCLDGLLASIARKPGELAFRVGRACVFSRTESERFMRYCIRCVPKQKTQHELFDSSK